MNRRDNIPILIISFNNWKYVRNTIQQIEKINREYLDDIIVVDNCSTDKNTLDYLDTLSVRLIRNSVNAGPWICPWCNVDIYNQMPQKFIVTDPDLEFNENLPTNFVQLLSEISDKYNSNKTGFALDISEPNKLFNSKLYVDGKSIIEWETQFWNHKIEDDNYDIYNATIDTTFCLFNKSADWSKNIRVAGNFTAKHLPWYINNPVYTISESIDYCKSSRRDISTISRILLASD